MIGPLLNSISHEYIESKHSQSQYLHWKRGFGKKYSRLSRSIMQPHHGEGLSPRPHCPHASLKYPLIPIYIHQNDNHKRELCFIQTITYTRMTIINENCVVYKQLDTCTRMTIINENFVTYKSLHTPGRQSYRKITYHVCDPLNFEKLKKPLIRRRVICVILNVYFVSYKSDWQTLKRIRRIFFIHTLFTNWRSLPTWYILLIFKNQEGGYYYREFDIVLQKLIFN